MEDQAKAIEKYKALVGKMVGDPAMVDKYIAGDASVTDETLFGAASTTFWERHKNDPLKTGPLLKNSRIEEGQKHKKAFLKALELTESEFEGLEDISEVFKKGKQTLESKLTKGATEKSESALQERLKNYEVALEDARKELKRLNDEELPLARASGKLEIENFKRQLWFLDYAKKIEMTVEDGFAKNAALEKIYGDIFGKYALYEHTDGKFYLADKETKQRIPKGQLDFLTLDEILVAKLREANMYKESNAKETRNKSTGGEGNPPNSKPPISDAQAEKLRKAEENLRRMEANAGQ